jgi:hypothetical protein
MALVPKINICINNKCNKVDIYEQTSPYSLAENPTGWGAPNIDTSNITSAILEVYDHTGGTLQDSIILYDGIVDVYSGVSGAPSPGSFLAISDEDWGLPDGIWKLVYTILDDAGTPNTYTNSTQHILFICGLINCADKLKGYIITECDSKKLTTQKSILDQLEIIIYGIQSAYSCGDFDKAISFIADGKVICDNLCECGCGDC